MKLTVTEAYDGVDAGLDELLKCMAEWEPASASAKAFIEGTQGTLRAVHRAIANSANDMADKEHKEEAIL